MCAHHHLAGGTVFQVPPDILQVLRIGALDWPITRVRLEKLVYFFVVQM
jgi:hypothetical protein